MRDADAVANLEFAPGGEDPSLERIVGSPLRVLAAYLERLPETAVLVIETGAGALTLFALRGGKSPLEERIALERASKALVDALVNLMRQQREDIARIARREPTSKKPIEQAAAAVWAAMPAAIRDAIGGARSLVYLPSAFGDLSAFPLELVRSEDGWLGADRSIARLSSLRTLFELLSPNRMPSQLDEGALVVRAQDSEELKGAETEVESVRRKLEGLGLKVEVDRSPRVESVRGALDKGLRTLHYCGHGFAGRLGETLPLGADEMLGPHDFSQLSGWGTPFVYLSTCEVGRARMTTTGSAAGISTRLIEKGAPGVVGCLESVPDTVANAMASTFYAAASTLPAGEALATARKELKRFPPSCWGAFAYFGDPSLQMRSSDRVVPQTRRLTLRWDSLVGRHLATRSPESRQRALDAIAAARAEQGAAADALDRVAGWVEASFRAEEPAMKDSRLELCRVVAREDAVAGCELRMLLAMEILQGCYFGGRKPDIVFAPEEVAVGLHCGMAIHDTIAWPAFVIECARSGGIGYERARVLHMLEEAVGMLEGWQLEEPTAGMLLSKAQELKNDLMTGHGP
jgi:hypothetical protein